MSNNNNNTLEEMMNEQEQQVEQMMNDILNNGNNNNNSKNKNQNNNVKNNGNNNSKNNNNNNNSKNNNNNNNSKNNNVKNNNKKNNNVKNNGNEMIEITIEDPESKKMIKLMMDQKATISDLKQKLEKEHRKKSHKFNIVGNENGEGIVLELTSIVSDHKNKKLKLDRKTRNFTLTEPLIKFKEYKGKKVEQENPYGSFDGSDPYPAARKAARKILRSKKLEGENIFKLPKFKFSIVEKTRGSKNKVYHYYGWNELKKPMKKDFGPRTETIEIEARVQKFVPSSNNNKSNNNKSNNNKSNNNKSNNNKSNNNK